MLGSMNHSDPVAVAGLVVGVASLLVSIAAWLISPERAIYFLKRGLGFIPPVFGISLLFLLWKYDFLKWLIHPASWLVWIVGAICCIFMTVVGMIIYAVALVGQKPARSSYRDDEIERVVWSWDWFNGLVDNSSLIPFCPKCATRLAFQFNDKSTNYRISGVPVSLVCQGCGFRENYEMSEKTLKNRVLLEIESRLNTGRYIERLKVKPPTER